MSASSRGLRMRAMAMLSAPWLAAACGTSSLDEPVPSAPTDTATASESSTTGLGTDTGAASTPPTGDETGAAEPGVCAPGCRIVLPVDWAYEGVRDPEGPPPEPHFIPALLREPDGGLLVAEQRGQFATLHRLSAAGSLQWNRPLPLPCDTCELADVSHHPSGDLLLSATGTVIDGDRGLLAGRYDPRTDQRVWAVSQPVDEFVGVPSRAGSIVAVSETAVAQLSLEAFVDFEVQQAIRLSIYGEQGVLLEHSLLIVQVAQAQARPLLARPLPNGDVAVALPRGLDGAPYASLDRVEAPLWNFSGAISLVQPVDDFEVDARDHTLALSRTFDGERLHLLLDDRAGLELMARWVATLAVPSTTESRAELAVGPDGDLYTAVRTTQRIELPPADDSGGEPDSGDEPEPGVDPLVGLSVARWSSSGELRWSTTVLMDIAPGPRPVALEVDELGGLLLATVAGGRLRAERWEPTCSCE